jgi:hypothetical protein
MDIHNNKAGNEIGKNNKGASDAELLKLVIQAIMDGKCVILDENGKIVPLQPKQVVNTDQNAKNTDNKKDQDKNKEKKKEEKTKKDNKNDDKKKNH